jgi:hypothetical protein
VLKWLFEAATKGTSNQTGTDQGSRGNRGTNTRNPISAALTIGLLTSTAIVTALAPNIAKAGILKSVEHAVSHETKSATSTVKKGAESTEKSAAKGVKSTTETIKKGSESTEKSARKDLSHVGEKTLKTSGVEDVAKASSKTIEKSVEHPQETAKGLEKDAKTDATDLAHGNVKKLMTDTAHQENAIDDGISKGTGVSVGTLKTINAMNGGAIEKAGVNAAEHPKETLNAINKDAKGAEMAARTDAADIKSGNASKLLRDTTNQQNALIAAQLKTEVAMSGVPIPKSMVNAAVSYQTTMNTMMTGQGAAAIVEALVHGKNGAALGMAMNDANTLQGNQVLNATNHEVSKATGISTAVLNTTEQVAMALAGGGEGAVASDAAKVVAKEAVEAASKDAVKAGVEAALKASAKQGAEAGAKDAAKSTVKAVASDTAKDAAKGAAKDAAKDATKDAAKSAVKAAAKDGAGDTVSAGVKDAADVIPKGIVQDRVAFFEGLGKAGTEDAAKAASADVAKATAEDAVKAMVEDAAKAEAAAGGAAKTAAKGGFDGAVKSRLTAAAEKAGKDAAEKGLDKEATKAAVEAAVKKEGENVAQETSNLARYAVESGGDPIKLAESVAKDAAKEAYQSLAGETKGFVGALKGLGKAAYNLGDDDAMVAAKAAAKDYTSRMMGNVRGLDPAIMDEVAARTTAKMDKAFVADSLYAYMTDPMKGGLKLATTIGKDEAEPAIDKKLDKAEPAAGKKLDKAEIAVDKKLDKAEIAVETRSQSH